MPAGSSNSSVVAVPLPAHLPDISGDVSDDVSGVEGGGGGGGGGGDVDDEDDVDDDDGGGVAAGDSGDAAATAPALGRPTLPRGTKSLIYFTFIIFGSYRVAPGFDRVLLNNRFPIEFYRQTETRVVWQ